MSDLKVQDEKDQTDEEVQDAAKQEVNTMEPIIEEDETLETEVQKAEEYNTEITQETQEITHQNEKVVSGTTEETTGELRKEIMDKTQETIHEVNEDLSLEQHLNVKTKPETSKVNKFKFEKPKSVIPEMYVPTEEDIREQEKITDCFERMLFRRKEKENRLAANTDAVRDVLGELIDNNIPAQASTEAMLELNEKSAQQSDKTHVYIMDVRTHEPSESQPAPITARSLSMDWENVLSQSAQSRSLLRVKGDRTEPHHPGWNKHARPTQEYCTGSAYTGQWDSLGMSGSNKYVLPHNVEYEGSLKDGMFHGEGTLTYPMGQKIDGIWSKGRLVSFKFRFADGLEYDTPWKYCQMPDRRFYACINEGLRPAGRSLLTNAQPTRVIPEGCYDVGDGFYNPTTKCVISPKNLKKIIRIPTEAEDKWIKQHCRKAWDESTGYRPDLYERWATGRMAEESDESEETSTDHTSENSENNDITFIHPPLVNFPNKNEIFSE